MFKMANQFGMMSAVSNSAPSLALMDVRYVNAPGEEIDASLITSGTINRDRLPTTQNQFVTIDPTMVQHIATKNYVDNIKTPTDANNQRIQNIADPTANQDAATKKYVDDKTFLQTEEPPSLLPFIQLTASSTHSLAFALSLINNANLTDYWASIKSTAEYIYFTIPENYYLKHIKIRQRLWPSTYNTNDNNYYCNEIKVEIKENNVWVDKTANLRYSPIDFDYTEYTINFTNESATNRSYRYAMKNSSETYFGIYKFEVYYTKISPGINANTIISGTLNKDRLPTTQNQFTITDPTQNQHVATKQYVDIRELLIPNKELFLRYWDYKYINEVYKPKLWISQYFCNGKIQLEDNTYKDNTVNTNYRYTPGDNMTKIGNIERKLKTTGTEDYRLHFDGTNSITSTVSFTTAFTFFILAQGDKNGRIFTSDVGNFLFGWWQDKQKCVHMGTEVYGINTNQTTRDENVHLFILRNNNDTKTFWENTKQIIETTNGENTWGKPIIGKPTVHANENGQSYNYEVLCFDYDLSNNSVSSVVDFIKSQYTHITIHSP